MPDRRLILFTMKPKTKKKKPAKKPAKKIRDCTTWGIRINDGFCEYEYILNGRNDTSIANVAMAVAAHVGAVYCPNGRHVKPVIMKTFTIHL